MDFDAVLDQIDGFGSYQKYIYFGAVIVSILVGAHMLSSVFLLEVPLSRCAIDKCDEKGSSFNTAWSNYSQSCSYFVQNEGNFSQTENSTCDIENFSNVSQSCSSWIYDRSESDHTAVSEWDLVCESGWVASTSGAVFMSGILVGSLTFGTIGDKFGRRFVFLIAPVVWVTTSFGAAFAQNWITFSVLKFFSGACITGIYTTTFVVVIEFVGVTKRAWCGNLFQAFFAVGELALAAGAYLFPNWRHLEILITAPITLLLLAPCAFPESVRWQLSKGKFSDAKATIRKVGKWNRKIVSDDLIEELIENSHKMLITPGADAGFLMPVLKSPVLLKRFINIFFNWMVNSLVYYGLSLSASNLGGNSLINFVALSAVEIPAIILATAIQQRKGRRLILCITMVLGGISCVTAAFLPLSMGWLVTTLAVFGKSNIAASFAVIYIYSAELFPTTLRNTGLGMSSMFSRVGGIFAPVIADLGHYNASLPMIIFGVSSLVAGITSLALPETHNKKLPETIEDAEKFGRSRKSVSIAGDSEESQRVPLLDQLEWT